MMLEERFGWPDAFYGKPNLKRWYNFLKKSDPSQGQDEAAFTAVTERVYGEIYGALKDWEANGR